MQINFYFNKRLHTAPIPLPKEEEKEEKHKRKEKRIPQHEAHVLSQNYSKTFICHDFIEDNNMVLSMVMVVVCKVIVKFIGLGLRIKSN